MHHTFEMKQSTLIYSLASGYNFYYYNSAERGHVLREREFILHHGKQKRRYYAEILPNDIAEKFCHNHWISLIRKPVDTRNHLWPVDIVKINGEDALVFPYRSELDKFRTINESGGSPNEKLLSNLVEDSNYHMGLDEPKNLRFIKGFLSALCRFEKFCYAYHEFTYCNIYIHEDTNEVMFDFSYSTYPATDFLDGSKVAESRINPDYADVFYYHKTTKTLDLASDYFSVAAILFKLLIGILPYQGCLLEGEYNRTEEDHDSWIKLYHKNPVFIFDPVDKRNEISETLGPDAYLDRWERLGTQLKQMFTDVFTTDNALRKTKDPIFYPPSKWQEALARIIEIL